MARHFFRQLVQTSIDCIKRGVVHRDIKEENIVVDLTTGETKLIDFGAATSFKNCLFDEFEGFDFVYK